MSLQVGGVVVGVALSCSWYCVKFTHKHTADHYLLQIQPYNFNSKPKTEATPKTEGAPKPDPQPSASKAEGEEGGSGTVPKDTPPQWYDVDVIKGTQCTVTGYSVSKETAQDQAEVRV